MPMAAPSSSQCLLFLLLASSSYVQSLSVTKPNHGSTSGQYYTLDSDSFEPPKTTCRAPKDPNPRRLTVYHRFGPCSPLTKRGKASPLAVGIQDTNTKMSNMLGSAFKTHNYVVTVGIGTPKTDVTVIMDTGSAITWVQCKPCSGCHDQKGTIFDPAGSSTYRNVSCSSSDCNRLPDYAGRCLADTCSYETRYMDKSHSTGFFASDTLSLTAGKSVPGFLFGCGQINKGLFGQSAGLLGLGPAGYSPSLLNQAGSSLGGAFAYCLPKIESTGYLEFGTDAGAGSGATFATLDDSGDNYGIVLVGMEVGGTELLRNKAAPIKMVVDTGTVVTRLPGGVHNVLKAAISKAVGKESRSTREDDTFDTCYEVRGKMKVPKVTLKFQGGARLELDPTGVFYRKSNTLWCLAFTQKDGKEDAVLGNLQQRTYRFSYDTGNQRLGLAPRAC